MYSLGLIYKKGEEGFEKNIEKAIDLFNKAIEVGNSSAMNSLALIYQYGDDGVKKDLEKARILFQKAIDLGNNNASENLKSLKKDNDSFLGQVLY